MTPIDVNGTILTGGTSFVATDASSNKLFNQTSAGYITKSTNSSNGTYLPMFNVGWSAEGWVNIGASGSWSVLPFRDTGNSGYYNVGSCYNTGNYRFTAPWTGLYVFKSHAYIYHPAVNVYTYYVHPVFTVNGSLTSRRPGSDVIYRMRMYGMPCTYGRDTDICELIYLTAGDYVQSVCYVSGGMQAYAQYSTFNGAYLGN